jgi:hypothetical protein
MLPITNLEEYIDIIRNFLKSLEVFNISIKIFGDWRWNARSRLKNIHQVSNEKKREFI